jgi:septum formation protein
VQDWLGYIGIDKIEGSFYNVMGLPVKELYEELIKF